MMKSCLVDFLDAFEHHVRATVCRAVEHDSPKKNNSNLRIAYFLVTELLYTFNFMFLLK